MTENLPLNSGADKPPLYTEITASQMNFSSQPPPGDSSTYYVGTTSWPPPPGYYFSATNTSNIGTCYGSTQSTIIDMPEIILLGGCPACRVGVMEDDYSCLGLLCAILFFPIGILCCLMLKTRRCSNCGAYFY